jgi:hypothetical protein
MNATMNDAVNSYLNTSPRRSMCSIAVIAAEAPKEEQ